MKSGMMTRRSFFLGAAAASVAPGVAKAMMAATGRDENLSVFISDVHVGGGYKKGQRTYQKVLFEQTVEEILRFNPRPARVVCFGDLAIWRGYLEDYAATLPWFNRLKDAGIDVYITLGNHDHRKPFLRCHPEYAKTSPVPGRIVSVVDLGTADLLLLDSLQESGPDGGIANAVGGTIDKEQWDWLRDECQKRTRPFFCGAHHAAQEMTQTVDGKKSSVLSFLKKAPLFRGWIHGHNHVWSKTFFIKDYESNQIFRSVALPSTGLSGDIGYALMRTYADRAELQLVMKDFFFPMPVKEGETRPPLWDAMVAEKRNESCLFTY